MIKKYAPLAVAIMFTAMSSMAQIAPTLTGYTLTYSSETPEAAEAAMGTLTDAEKAACTGDFSDRTKLESNWSYCQKSQSTWNERMAETAEEQAQVVVPDNGTLRLKALSKDGTAAGVITGGLRFGKPYTYGLYEVKATCHAHTSNFPAIWMMPHSGKYGPWPTCGEIDIMEQVGNNSTVYSTVHLGARYDEKVGKTYAWSGNMWASDNEAHVYSLLWEEKALTFYCDGKQIFKYSKDETLDYETHPEYEYYQYPYNYPFVLILNQSVGKNSGWGAEDPDPSYTYEMDVDWVRYYTAPEGDRTPTNYYTFRNYTDPTRYMTLTADSTISTRVITDRSQLTTNEVFSIMPTDVYTQHTLQSRADPNLRIAAPSSTVKAVLTEHAGAYFYIIKDDTKGTCFDTRFNVAGKTGADGSKALRMNANKNYIVTAGGNSIDASWWILEDAKDITTGITDVKATSASTSARKTIRDNRLIITDGNSEYTAQGTRLK